VVRAAVADDRVEVGGRRYKERLLPYVGTYVGMRAFTKAVLLELTDGDFMSSVRYGDATYDEYGVAISEGTQAMFGVEGLETWYVKFTMDERPDGEVVLMASLHEPERSLQRAGGILKVRFSRRTE
jgi:hypothetical protein